MGKHSSSRQGAYYRSLIAWFLPWVLLGAIAVTGVTIAVDALGRDELDTPPPGAATGSPSPTPSASRSRSPSPSPSPSPAPSRTENVELIVDGVTVQVLNGTNEPLADDMMADRLARLGYDVLALNASRGYEETTVFWSTPGSRRAAQALASRFGWLVALKPDNLSAGVDLHVVVGRDEA